MLLPKTTNYKHVLVFGSPFFQSNVRCKQQITRQIGRTIVGHPRYCLVTGGSLGDENRGYGVDYHAAHGAMEFLRRGKLPSNKLLTIVPESNDNRFSCGTVIVDRVPDSKLRRLNLVSLADAVVTIEGGPGTTGLIDLALKENTPVIPIGGTGGASSDAWSREDVRGQMNLEAIRERVPHLVKELTREDFRSETVNSIIEVLLSYWLGEV